MKIPAEKPPTNENSAASSGNTATGHDSSVIGALDAICSSSEQTYEQMMQSFTYLTPGMLKSDLAMHIRSPIAVSSAEWLCFKIACPL